jgi:hypothetical protein
MIEREMEDLLWEHPERFLNEPLRQFERQSASTVGRADLIFLDRIGRLIVVELKRDTLERGAIPQLVDYFGMVKARFPDKAVELMIIANRIPQERRLACEQFDIEAVEISQKRFRDVADKVGYAFNSEGASQKEPQATGQRYENLPRLRAKVEKEWFYSTGRDRRGYYLAFVNAQGSCSMRRFDADSGAFLGKEYKSGDYQQEFSEYLKGALPLRLSHQPNLERDCRRELPTYVLDELGQQIHEGEG